MNVNFLLFIFSSLFFSSPFILSLKSINAFIDENTNTITYQGHVYFIAEEVKTQVTEINPSNDQSTLGNDNNPSQTTPNNDNIKKSKKYNEPSKSISYAEFWLDVIIVALLTLFAGIMSGLTVGYLSIDELILEIKSTTGDPEEIESAKKIQPVIENHHWLLVTLLVCNSLANETLPIVLDRIVSEVMAVVISVTLLLFFGEIIPQALCTGPNQLKIASTLAPLTLSLMYLTSPISYPLSLFVDYVIGKPMKTRFSNKKLKALIKLHTEEIIDKIRKEENIEEEDDEELGLTKEQVNLMMGALDVKERKVKEIMIPMHKVVMLNVNDKLTNEKIRFLQKEGYSRIPVYQDDVNKVIGILRTKQLINVDLSQNKSLRELNIILSHPLIIDPEMLTMDLLNEFRKGKSHMAFVTKEVKKAQELCGLDNKNSYKENLNILKFDNLGSDKYLNELTAELLGIVTLEDVIEKMINIQILDEDDYKAKKMKDKKRKKLRSAMTQKICKSFIDEKKEQIGSLIKGISYDDDKLNNENTEHHYEGYQILSDEK